MPSASGGTARSSPRDVRMVTTRAAIRSDARNAACRRPSTRIRFSPWARTIGSPMRRRPSDPGAASGMDAPPPSTRTETTSAGPSTSIASAANDRGSSDPDVATTHTATGSFPPSRIGTVGRSWRMDRISCGAAHSSARSSIRTPDSGGAVDTKRRLDTRPASASSTRTGVEKRPMRTVASPVQTVFHADPTRASTRKANGSLRVQRSARNDRLSRSSRARSSFSSTVRSSPPRRWSEWGGDR